MNFNVMDWKPNKEEAPQKTFIQTSVHQLKKTPDRNRN
jgi:hypothetical protein